MEYQIRRYKVADGCLEEFSEVFWTQIVPLRERFGFVVDSVWTTDETREFLWIVGYDGVDGFTAANDAYYASPARESVRPNPLDFLDEVNVAMATRAAPQR